MKNNTRTKNARRNCRIFNTIKAYILMTLLFFILPGIAGWYEIHYTMDGEITDVIAEEIIVEDTTGNLWSFEGDGYAVGDKVRVTFCTMGTDSTRQDDEIEQVKVIRN